MTFDPCSRSFQWVTVMSIPSFYILIICSHYHLLQPIIIVVTVPFSTLSRVCSSATCRFHCFHDTTSFVGNLVVYRNMRQNVAPRHACSTNMLQLKSPTGASINTWSVSAWHQHPLPTSPFWPLSTARCERSEWSLLPPPEIRMSYFGSKG